MTQLADRLALFRSILDEPKPNAAPDIDTLVEAFSRALGRFSTQDGALRVWSESGSHVRGGS